MKLWILSAAMICLAALALGQAAQNPTTPVPPNPLAPKGANAGETPILQSPGQAPAPEEDVAEPDIEPPPDPILDPLHGMDEIMQRITQGSRVLFEQLPPPPDVVLRAIIGFVILLVLAYLAGHPRVQRLERRLNIAHFTTAGLPFVFLGLIASQPVTGILPPAVLTQIGPLLPLGLGWIGFVIGARFSGAALSKLGPGVGAAVVMTTCIPLATIFIATTFVLRAFDPLLVVTQGREALRDGIILAAAGAMAARSAPHFFATVYASLISRRMIRIIEMEQLGGVFTMMMISAFFRPISDVIAWQLPGAAWLFVIFGVGSIMGLVVAGVLNSVSQGSQFTAALLGAVAFTAGMASYLRLSAIAVCFIAGSIMMNLRGTWREQARRVLERMERPIYFVFLFIAGALWHPWEWQGWVLMAVFVASRFASKWVAAFLVSRFWLPDVNPAEKATMAGAPMGALSVAMIVSAQDLYSGPTVGWFVTAIIGATIVREITLQIIMRRTVRPATLTGQHAAHHPTAAD